jgi:hypothetical protein
VTTEKRAFFFHAIRHISVQPVIFTHMLRLYSPAT